MLWRVERDVQKRPPFRALWFADQCHLRFLWQAIAFHRVTWNARTDDILPRRRSTTIPRDHVIEIQIVAIECLAAVLAGVLVPFEHVMPRKLHFLFRQAIEEQEHDDARHTDLPGNRLNELVVGRIGRKIPPAFEIVGQEIVCVIRRDNVSVAGVNERERPPGGADVHRLPQAVEHQDLTI